MATIQINPTSATSNNGWAVYNAGNLITAITDGDPTTFAYNLQPNTLASFLQVTSSQAAPADFANSTITEVRLYYALSSTNHTGDFSFAVYGPSGSTGSGTVFNPGNSSRTFTRPGGGPWLYTDFFNSSFKWAVASAGNADDPSRNVGLYSFYIVVTYTPTSGPTAAFTVNTTTGTAPLSVNFTDQGTGSPTGWLWSFGDTQTSSLQSPTHVYTTDGTYTVTFTESNAGGTSTITTNNLIHVNTALAAVVAEFTAAPVSGVQNLGVHFFDKSTGTPSPNAWLWAFGDGSTSTSQNPTHVYTTVGTYTVTLTASNATPTTNTNTKTSYVTVADGRPVPSFAVDTNSGRRPLTVTFTGTYTNAVPLGWSWDFDDGLFSSARNPTHVYQTEGIFVPVLTVSNAIGTASVSTFVIGTDTTPQDQIDVGFAIVTAEFTAAPTMGYAPLSVRFTDETTGDAFEWLWEFGDTVTAGTSEAFQHVSHVYTEGGGPFNYALTVTEHAASSGVGTGEPVNEDTETKDDLLCVLNPDETYGYFFEELKYMLMEPMWDQTICEGFEAFGGMSQILKLTKARINRFIVETACYRATATLTETAGAADVYEMPEDHIETLDVWFDNKRALPLDMFQQDKSPISERAYALEYPHKFKAFATTTPTTVEMYYVRKAPEVTVPSDCSCPENGSTGMIWPPFPLPYTLWWIIRYGVLADIFNQAGDRNDPERAQQCEKLFQEGVQIYNLLYRDY